MHLAQNWSKDFWGELRATPLNLLHHKPWLHALLAIAARFIKSFVQSRHFVIIFQRNTCVYTKVLYDIRAVKNLYISAMRNNKFLSWCFLCIALNSVIIFFSVINMLKISFWITDREDFTNVSLRGIRVQWRDRHDSRYVKFYIEALWLFNSGTALK